jgi:hypothetical protein
MRNRLVKARLRSLFKGATYEGNRYNKRAEADTKKG